MKTILRTLLKLRCPIDHIEEGPQYENYVKEGPQHSFRIQDPPQHGQLTTLGLSRLAVRLLKKPTTISARESHPHLHGRGTDPHPHPVRLRVPTEIIYPQDKKVCPSRNKSLSLKLFRMPNVQETQMFCMF